MSASEILAPVAGMSLPEAAQHYAAHGVPVFPCLPGGKQPLTARGFRDASSDPHQIAAWWQWQPEANVALPTGPASGLEVVDVDVKGESPRGPESWARARSAGLLNGWTAQVVTPSGGLHLYFPVAPQEQRSWASRLAQIDFRGSGGYVVAPPSRISAEGRVSAYELLDVGVGTHRAVDAGALREFLDPRPQRPAWTAGTFHGTPESHVARITAWLAAQQEGGRNQGLFWASCRLVEHGSTLEEVFATLGPVAEQLGLPPREIDRTIRSAARSQTAQVRPPASSPAPHAGAKGTSVNTGRVVT